MAIKKNKTNESGRIIFTRIVMCKALFRLIRLNKLVLRAVFIFLRDILFQTEQKY